MRLLVVNVNTTASMTESIAGLRPLGRGRPEPRSSGLTPRYGAESVEGNFESYLAAVAVMERRDTPDYDGPFDAVVQAGFGEHGREGLQELLDVPVVDITEAAGHVASPHRLPVLGGHDPRPCRPADRGPSHCWPGSRSRCASVRSSGLGVLQLEQDHEVAVATIVSEAKKAVRERQAEVICLGCGGMAGSRRGGTSGHRCPGRGRGHRGRQAGREPRRARPVHEQDPHLRNPTSERVDAWSWHDLPAQRPASRTLLAHPLRTRFPQEENDVHRFGHAIDQSRSGGPGPQRTPLQQRLAAGVAG